MRRKYLFSVLLLFFTLLCSIFLSCADGIADPPVNQVLDAETERLLKQDYWRYIFDDARRSVFTAEEVWIDYYLGTYNGYVIFVVSGNRIQGYIAKEYFNISLGGYEFLFRLSPNMYAWKQGAKADKGSFYILNKTTFKSLSLTSNDAKGMYEKYLAYNVVSNENFYPGSFQGLDEKTKQQIKNDYWRDFFVSWWLSEISAPEELWIDYYLGTYNGYAIIVVMDHSKWPGRIIIDDLEFIFPTDFRMFAWKQDEDTESGTFYRILSEQDFMFLSLTPDDAKGMYERYLTFKIQNKKYLISGVFDGLDAETAWHIKNDFSYKETNGYTPPDGIYIDHYLGAWNGYEIFVKDSPQGLISGFTIDGYEFTFGGLAPTFAWKKGENFENNQLYRVRRYTNYYGEIDWDEILRPGDAKKMYKHYLKFRIMEER